VSRLWVLCLAVRRSRRGEVISYANAKTGKMAWERIGVWGNALFPTRNLEIAGRSPAYSVGLHFLFIATPVKQNTGLKRRNNNETLTCPGWNHPRPTCVHFTKEPR